MNNLNLDKYLNIVNDEKVKKGLTNYIPLYPMLRMENEKLYVSITPTYNFSFSILNIGYSGI